MRPGTFWVRVDWEPQPDWAEAGVAAGDVASPRGLPTTGLATSTAAVDALAGQQPDRAGVPAVE